MGNQTSVGRPHQKELARACLKGDLRGCQLAIAAGGDPNLHDKYGWSALHHCCTEGHLDLVRFLLEKHHGSVHSANAEGATPLMLAVTSRRIALVSYLLKHGALVNERQHEGLTALHLAAIMQDAQLVQLLLRKGADATLVDEQDRTPVQLCDKNAELIAAFAAQPTTSSASASTVSSEESFESAPDAPESGARVVSRSEIELLCTTLHETFAGVDDVDAIDEMLAFYKSEIAELSRRRQSLAAQVAQERHSTESSDSEKDDDELVNGSDDEMKPLLV